MTRSYEEIARGLALPRPARPIAPGTRIHVIGVGGAASAGAALHADAIGATVTACDAGGQDPLTVAVEAAGIPVEWGHDAAHVRASDGTATVDRVAVTKAVTSVDPDHPELVAARAAGIVPESVQQVIADACATRGRRLVAVTGTHGKSTTTAWLLHLLVTAGRDPTGFVGAILPSSITSDAPGVARFGDGPEFVVEADEYAGNFDPYWPAVTVLVSVEWDHPDVFGDEASVVRAVADWIVRPAEDPAAPVLVAFVGDPGVAAVVAAVRASSWPGRIMAVVLDPPDVPEAAVVVGRTIAADGGGTELSIVGLRAGSDQADRVRIRQVGRHLAIDALMAAAGALAVGADPAAIVAGLGTFDGVGRRFELKGEVDGVTVIDDYAHHPTAIRLTLDAARQRYPGRRLWAVYEPLTYHRTAAMLDTFADVLAAADRAVVVDIWAVRDPDTTVTSATALAEAVSRRSQVPAEATGTPESTASWLADAVESGDVVLVMGGGRSYVVADELVERLAARVPRA